MSTFVDSYIRGVRTLVTQIMDTVQQESFFASAGSQSGSVIILPPAPPRTPETSSTVTVIVLLFLLWQILFSVGGAIQSYRYNLSVGTSPMLTVIYVLLCFSFPYIYYPFHTFVLSSDTQSVGQYGGRRK